MKEHLAPFDYVCRNEAVSTVYRFCVLFCLGTNKIAPIDHIFAEIIRPENKYWMDILKQMLGVDSVHEACKFFLIADEDGTVATSRKVSHVLSKVLGQMTISEVERADAHKRFLKRKEEAARKRAELEAQEKKPN